MISISIKSCLLLFSVVQNVSVINGEKNLSYEFHTANTDARQETESESLSKVTCTATTDQSSDRLTAANPQFRANFIAPLDLVNPFCVKFEDYPDLNGFDVCPGLWDNVDVTAGSMNTYNDPITSGTGDYLHVRDRSNGSLVCGTGANYTGDWNPVATQRCYSLCFDVALLEDACRPNYQNCEQDAVGNWYLKYYPRIIIQGGAPTYYRAVFIANDPLTDQSNPSEWRTICAPIAPLGKGGELPSNEQGSWHLAGTNDILSGSQSVSGPAPPNSAWNSLLADVTAIQLPVDFTNNPAERIGYDNICLIEGECTDFCDPEPLCFWQHEWDCAGLKKEEWYSNFTEIVDKVVTFNNKNLCVCGLLDQCCPDLCDFAEQEFAALLLNVASDRLALDCGVEECDDCTLTIKSIIKIVDKLLSLSSRSDYDCSKALDYLTGVNLDENLCDDPPNDECVQTEQCKKSGGLCIDKADCNPNDPFVICEDNICDTKDCTCAIPVDCPQDPLCKRVNGKCIPEADCDKESLNCDSTRCTSGDNCVCAFKECSQTDTCKSERGMCVDDCKEVPGQIVCKDSCEQNTGCQCQIKVDLPCRQTADCDGKGGECVRDCMEIPGLVKCVDDLCENDNNCSCRIKNIVTECPQTKLCHVNDGNCVQMDDCVPDKDTKCYDRWCKDGCTCEVNNCEQNVGCINEDGLCEKGCVENFFSSCDKELCPTLTPGGDFNQCECKTCKQVDKQCTLLGGTCMPDEVCREKVSSISGSTCNPEMCGGKESECSCLMDRQISCPLTNNCKRKGGKCVPNMDCKNSGDNCEPICESEDCLCQIPDVGDCPDTANCLDRFGRCVTKEECRFSGASCEDICEGEDCTCKIDGTECNPTKKCTLRGGECVIARDCNRTVSDCEEICDSKECLCEIPKVGCTKTEACDDEGGQCVPKEDCEIDPNDSFSFKCAALCDNAEGCLCKIPTIEDCPTNDECILRLGECVIANDCNSDDSDCLEICDSEECVCEIPKVGCTQTDACDDEGGQCVLKEDCKFDPNDPFAFKCEALCDNTEGCLCKIPTIEDCPTNDECSLYKGKCVIANDCNSDDSDCLKICDSEECVCDVPKVGCTKTEACDDKGGQCVPKEDCEIDLNDPFSFKCEALCDDPEDCLCKIPAQADCVTLKNCERISGECIPLSECKSNTCIPDRCDGENCACNVKTCVDCDDRFANAWKGTTKTCETESSESACNKPGWIRNNICAQTCFDIGFEYQICCSV